MDIGQLSAEGRAEIERLLGADSRPWRVLPGPQAMARASTADIIGYGGAAGGGKSDLICGLALTEHQRTVLFRREKAQTKGLVQRIGQILGSTDGYSSQSSEWVYDGRLIEFGGLDNPGDESRWQGRPHDLIGIDEATEVRESQARFVVGWLRSDDPAQRKRVLMTFNPPMSPEGRWIIKMFGPWLDRKHPHPAAPGEIRWFTTIGDNEDYEVPDERPFVVLENGDFDYSFDAATVPAEKIVRPMSRTFIPARVVDNPYYAGTNYMSVLQAMPEPMRSRMLYGDFDAGIEDDPFQVIPTAWVLAAMKRWKRPSKLPPMDSLGADIALKGRDNTVIARRHGWWFDEPVVHKGRDCLDGATVAGFIVAALRDEAVIHLDLFGVGAHPYGHLMALHLQVVGVTVGEPTAQTVNAPAKGKIGFDNLRSCLWWRMREALDPQANTGIELPDNRELLADLCGPKFAIRGQRIEVQGRKEIIDDLGRSPDYGSAYVLALMDTPKHRVARALLRGNRRQREYDPYENI
jgi:hypothetical protein